MINSILAGVVSGLPKSCYLMLPLQLPATMFACGPLRLTKLAQRFVARAFATDRRHPASWAEKHCAAEMDSFAGWTGAMTPRRAMSMYMKKVWGGLRAGRGSGSTIHETLRAVLKHNDSSAMPTCPPSERWDVDVTAPHLARDECHRLRLHGCDTLSVVK